ncbi:MAG: Crp/Fnr family transcriptional regulator [Gammaproteobacteria bacterium]|nr:Crp/Fnr family transcriptional regulator [Gammaproteobacteria bacterium]
MFQLKSKSKRLIAIFDGLDKASQQSLLDFAEFLQTKTADANGAELARIQEPNLIPAKEGESVILALKRLSASYPMLDKSKLLNDTSVLVTEHTLQGRDRDEVIAELDVVFKQHYQNYVDEGTKE